MGTKIQITGTKGELLAALRIMQYYETDCLMQFMDCDDGSFLEWVTLRTDSGDERLDEFSDKKLIEFLKECVGEGEDSGTINLTACGPFGSEICIRPTLFMHLAEAIPSAAFTGEMEEYGYGAAACITAALKGGKLYIDYYLDCDNPTGYEDYIDFIASRISSEEFCRLFRTTEGAIRATAIGNYLDVIWEFRAWAIPFDGRDYDNFMNMTDRACSLSKLEFEEAIKTMVEMGVKDYDTFMEEDYREEDHTSHFVYDPIMKRRIPDRKTYCTVPTVAWLKQ